MAYTVKTRTGGVLLEDGDEVEAIKVVTNHNAPDVLNVWEHGKKMNGAEFLQQYDASDAIRQLRGMWPGKENAKDMLNLRKDAR
jgi:hypothetical protein